MPRGLGKPDHLDDRMKPGPVRVLVTHCSGGSRELPRLPASNRERDRMYERRRNQVRRPDLDRQTTSRISGIGFTGSRF